MQQSFLSSKGINIEQIHVRLVDPLISRHGRIVHNRLTGAVAGRWQIPDGLLFRLSHGNIGNVTASGRIISGLPLMVILRIVHGINLSFGWNALLLCPVWRNLYYLRIKSQADRSTWPVLYYALRWQVDSKTAAVHKTVSLMLCLTLSPLL